MSYTYQDYLMGARPPEPPLDPPDDGAEIFERALEYIWNNYTIEDLLEALPEDADTESVLQALVDLHVKLYDQRKPNAIDSVIDMFNSPPELDV